MFNDTNKKTPIGAIRQKCMDCEESKQNIKNCEFNDCPCYPYRIGKNPNRQGIGGAKALINSNNKNSLSELAKSRQTGHASKVLSPMRSIRKACLICMEGQYGEIKKCPSFECPLYSFRFGKRGNKIIS